MDYFQHHLTAGVDEVGRGCLAGPVFAAAVILPSDYQLPGLTDSKKLTAQKREELSVAIRAQAIAFQIMSVSVDEIDQINIFHASFKAMRLALEAISEKPQLVLVDGKFKIPELSVAQQAIVKGDESVPAISAASIIAKVARDQWMTEQQEHYPQFQFSKHKGYGTPEHLRELQQHGPTKLHRFSFEPVRLALQGQRSF